MRSALYYTNMLNWISIVLAHWNNSPRIDMSLYLDTLSWFGANPSLIFILTAMLRSTHVYYQLVHLHRFSLARLISGILQIHDMNSCIFRNHIVSCVVWAVVIIVPILCVCLHMVKTSVVWFNPTTWLCLSFNRTWIFNPIYYVMAFGSMISGEK